MKLIDYTKSRESQRSLADKLGITPVLISQWANAQRPVPPERCVEIEVATSGEVTRKDLRPSDWQKIWPELVSIKGDSSGLRHVQRRKVVDRRAEPAEGEQVPATTG